MEKAVNDALMGMVRGPRKRIGHRVYLAIAARRDAIESAIQACVAQA